MIGSFGNAEVFSFHATKFCNSFEGGAVTTDDDELAAKLRLMKNFGFAGYDNVTYIGTNGKMSELSAAMGLTSLESLDQFVAINRRNYQHYRRLLDRLPGVKAVEYDEGERNNYQYVVLEIDEARAGLHRDALLKILHAEQVLARRYFYPGCHRMEPYRSYFPHAGLLLPVTETLVGRVLSLPTGSAVTEAQIEAIASIIRVAVENAGRVNEYLSSGDGALPRAPWPSPCDCRRAKTWGPSGRTEPRAPAGRVPTQGKGGRRGPTATGKCCYGVLPPRTLPGRLLPRPLSADLL